MGDVSPRLTSDFFRVPVKTNGEAAMTSTGRAQEHLPVFAGDKGLARVFKARRARDVALGQCACLTCGDVYLQP